jgi:RNA polymerase subunit RPABC4/transcription elongation factor Spt4
MSATTEPTPARSVEAAADACAHCGARLTNDQEWCIECGAARTYLHRPPDWRLGAAIVVLVVALVAAAFTIALVNLSDHADRVAGADAASAAASSAPPVTFAGWPAGARGYTVVLASSPSRATAEATTRRLAAAGLSVGILDASAHPGLRTNRWAVFVGRFPTRAVAQARAAALRAQGYLARPAAVGSTGG